VIFLVGFLGFANVPPLQKRVLDKAARAPTLASAVNIGAFNLGNALAAWLGGIVIDAGFGYATVNLVGAALTTTAVVLAALSAMLERVRVVGRDSASPTEMVSVGNTAG
jgi:DHA1 family inner membrane transport protein